MAAPVQNDGAAVFLHDAAPIGIATFLSLQIETGNALPLVSDDAASACGRRRFALSAVFIL
jgi:hypothetical protein